MEEKMKRESKLYLENLFKKYDKIGAGAVKSEDMKKIIYFTFPEFTKHEELDELVACYTRVSKYQVFNHEKHQMEVRNLEDAIDFPSAFAILVHFRQLEERRDSNLFSGQSLVKFTDLPPGMGMLTRKASDKNRRLF